MDKPEIGMEKLEQKTELEINSKIRTSVPDMKRTSSKAVKKILTPL